MAPISRNVSNSEIPNEGACQILVVRAGADSLLAPVPDRRALGRRNPASGCSPADPCRPDPLSGDLVRQAPTPGLLLRRGSPRGRPQRVRTEVGWRSVRIIRGYSRICICPPIVGRNRSPLDSVFLGVFHRLRHSLGGGTPGCGSAPRVATPGGALLSGGWSPVAGGSVRGPCFSPQRQGLICSGRSGRLDPAVQCRSGRARQNCSTPTAPAARWLSPLCGCGARSVVAAGRLGWLLGAGMAVGLDLRARPFFRSPLVAGPGAHFGLLRLSRRPVAGSGGFLLGPAVWLAGEEAVRVVDGRKLCRSGYRRPVFPPILFSDSATLGLGCGSWLGAAKPSPALVGVVVACACGTGGSLRPRELVARTWPAFPLARYGDGCRQPAGCRPHLPTGQAYREDSRVGIPPGNLLLCAARGRISILGISAAHRRVCRPPPSAVRLLLSRVGCAQPPGTSECTEPSSAGGNSGRTSPFQPFPGNRELSRTAAFARPLQSGRGDLGLPRLPASRTEGGRKNARCPLSKGGQVASLPD